jgi:hypothetical protein
LVTWQSLTSHRPSFVGFFGFAHICLLATRDTIVFELHLASVLWLIVSSGVGKVSTRIRCLRIFELVIPLLCGGHGVLATTRHKTFDLTVTSCSYLHNALCEPSSA